VKDEVKVMVQLAYANKQLQAKSSTSSSVFSSLWSLVSTSNEDTTSLTQGGVELTELPDDEWNKLHKKSKKNLQDYEDDDEEKKIDSDDEMCEETMPYTKPPIPPMEIRTHEDALMSPLGSSNPSILTDSLLAPPGIDLATRQPTDAVIDHLAVLAAVHQEDNEIDTSSAV